MLATGSDEVAVCRRYQDNFAIGFCGNRVLNHPFEIQVPSLTRT